MTGYRQGQIVKLYDALKAAGGAGLTHLDAARVLGIKKSPYTLGLLREMVQKGWAVEARADNEPRAPFRYYVPSGQ